MDTLRPPGITVESSLRLRRLGINTYLEPVVYLRSDSTLCRSEGFELAKLAGAPLAKSAGVDLHVTTGQNIAAGEPLCTLHAETPGELSYALQYAERHLPYSIGE